MKIEERKALVDSLQNILDKKGDLTLDMGIFKIVHVKSISSWGDGLFYGFRKYQKAWSKSVNMDNIVSFS